MRFNNRGDAALYVWDYFFVSHHPALGDEKSWSAIERATHRIRESEMYLDAPHPLDRRLRSARRVRNAARLALREIDQLSTQTEAWVIEALANFDVVASAVIAAVAEPARRLVLH